VEAFADHDGITARAPMELILTRMRLSPAMTTEVILTVNINGVWY
jgi:hypothetical protein